MGRTISNAFELLLAEDITRLVTCLDITPQGLTPLRLTDHNEDININGIVYSSKSGYTRSAISSTDTIETGTVTLTGIFDETVIDIKGILAGIYNYTPAKLFAVDYSSLVANIVTLIQGTVGEIELQTSLNYSMEIRDLKQYLSNVIGEVYTIECRADLGDSRCTVPIINAPWARNMSVASVVNRNEFMVMGDTGMDEHYKSGHIKWETGDNANISHEIIEIDSSVVKLYLSTLYTIKVGDTLTLYPGCDKTLNTCITRYDNRLNFRGEPFLPGRDLLGKYGDRPPSFNIG